MYAMTSNYSRQIRSTVSSQTRPRYRRIKALSAIAITAVLTSLMYLSAQLMLTSKSETSGAPPYGIKESQVPSNLNPLSWLEDWQRPAGPPKVGIQVGHWQHKNAPEELKNLRNNSGASGGGYSETEVNLAIATKIKDVLEAEGVTVELLPTTIPPGYWADVFISIHADGSTDPNKSGYKFAAPWRDFSGNADYLVNLLETSYQTATDLEKDLNVTRNMRGYYAFSWWRYSHAIHPMTTAVIAETGFLTNANDRRLLTQQPDIPAKALAEAILSYLQSQNLLT